MTEPTREGPDDTVPTPTAVPAAAPQATHKRKRGKRGGKQHRQRVQSARTRDAMRGADADHRERLARLAVLPPPTPVTPLLVVAAPNVSALRSRLAQLSTRRKAS